MTGPAREFAQPITRPEGAVLNLLEAILSFETARNYRKADRVAMAFLRQPDYIKTAIRKDWLVDHLPFYAAMVDLSIGEFEKDLAERFWAEIEQEAEQNYKPPKRQEVAV